MPNLPADLRGMFVLSAYAGSWNLSIKGTLRSRRHLTASSALSEGETVTRTRVFRPGLHSRAIRGFTLVEVIVSLAVFAAITMIFATSIPLVEKASHVNGQYAQAISLCQHKIDQVRAVGYGRLNYTELSDAGIIDSSPTSQPFSFAVVDDVGDFLPQPQAQMSIVDLTAGKVCRVTVTITWKQAAHTYKTSQLSISALVANVE